MSLEIAQIHAYWEDSLYAVTAFPKADEKNWRVLGMIEQIVEDRKLIGPSNDADKRVLVEVFIICITVWPDASAKNEYRVLISNPLFHFIDDLQGFAKDIPVSPHPSLLVLCLG